MSTPTAAPHDGMGHLNVKHPGPSLIDVPIMNYKKDGHKQRS
ncbi:hypothetical protein HanXRQr2_Chr01g0033151 [Helianthus annuus]|uniref:Uncharacterized protein n=1 Tax=Helianthus annuus TaxID=4232 RepID=A0A9K3JYF8_HELAN|nr:hypothetical protein HanXRQr2_Chr01g0033151 [Helianthus annuus]KAJ0957832.1 hypothetical protein HanPSC8_Chr01g0032251 [Helianthus annuus]